MFLSISKKKITNQTNKQPNKKHFEMSSLKQFKKWKTVTLSQCVIKWVMIANEVVVQCGWK